MKGNVNGIDEKEALFQEKEAIVMLQSPFRPLENYEIHSAPFNIALNRSFSQWAQQSRKLLSMQSISCMLFDALGTLISMPSLQVNGEDLERISSIVHNRIVSGQINVAAIPSRTYESKDGRLLFIVSLSVKEGVTAAYFAILYYPADELALREQWKWMLQSYVPYLYNEIEKHYDYALQSGKELVYQWAHKLTSLKDVNSILAETIWRLENMFPEASFRILLAQDNLCPHPHVQVMQYTPEEDDVYRQAFQDGKAVRYATNGGKDFEAVAPLTGNQGVYGVVHMYSPNCCITKESLELFILLSNVAGTAFESAKLYEQSNQLITELLLINEITKRLNQSLKLSDIFDFTCAELLTIFEAEYCCILQYDGEREHLIVRASNVPSLYSEEFSTQYGYSGVVAKTKEPLLLSDYWEEKHRESAFMNKTDSRSLIAAPIIVHSEVVGILLVSHTLPYYFSYDNYRLLQVLSGHIGLAIVNASLHDEVKRMVITDQLTGLYTRSYLDDQILLFLQKDTHGSLIVIDIDDFKMVNDTYGHQVGDKVLMQICQIIRTCIRDSDIPARWGGEELAIYLPLVSLEQAIGISERIRKAVYEETQPRVTVSCGLADWSREQDEESLNVELLFYRADMALYNAKNSGKNQSKSG